MDDAHRRPQRALAGRRDPFELVVDLVGTADIHLQRLASLRQQLQRDLAVRRDPAVVHGGDLDDHFGDAETERVRAGRQVARDVAALGRGGQLHPGGVSAASVGRDQVWRVPDAGQAEAGGLALGHLVGDRLHRDGGVAVEHGDARRGDRAEGVLGTELNVAALPLPGRPSQVMITPFIATVVRVSVPLGEQVHADRAVVGAGPSVLPGQDIVYCSPRNGLICAGPPPNKSRGPEAVPLGVVHHLFPLCDDAQPIKDVTRWGKRVSRAGHLQLDVRTLDDPADPDVVHQRHRRADPVQLDLRDVVVPHQHRGRRGAGDAVRQRAGVGAEALDEQHDLAVALVVAVGLGGQGLRHLGHAVLEHDGEVGRRPGVLRQGAAGVAHHLAVAADGHVHPQAALVAGAGEAEHRVLALGHLGGDGFDRHFATVVAAHLDGGAGAPAQGVGGVGVRRRQLDGDEAGRFRDQVVRGGHTDLDPLVAGGSQVHHAPAIGVDILHRGPPPVPIVLAQQQSG